MARRPGSAGGIAAVRYSLAKLFRPGPVGESWQSLRSRNSCKTCAVGMGGQRGGMVNEAGHFPEVCKKSLQALASDAQPAIPSTFWDSHPLSRLQEMSPYELEHAGRLTEPVLLSRDRYRPLSWAQAMDLIVSQLRETPPDRTFWYLSGRSSNEAGFLAQLLARDYGTNNVNNCSFYCHQASGVGLKSTIGTGTATVDLAGLENADLVFLIGGNPASNHPRLMNSLKRIRRKGGEVIVVNPIKELGLERFRVPSDVGSMIAGTKIASQFLQLHSGSDVALLYGLAKAVIDTEGHDVGFLTEHAEGADEFIAAVRAASWTAITTTCGVSQAELQRAAASYVQAKNVVFAWTMGITHHTNGVANVETIASVALLRGMVGRPNAGLLPIRGHSNVQGIGSVGVTPQLQERMLTTLAEKGLVPPPGQGWDTMACIEAAAAGEADFGFCLGGNLYGSNPDAHFAAQALNKLRTIVYVSTTLNTGHAHGVARQTLILPALARDEEPAPTSQESMFNYVRLSDGGPPRLPGPRSECDILVDIAEPLLAQSRIPWPLLRDRDEVRRWISDTVPGYADLANSTDEFSVSGRILATPNFPTRSGRARLVVHPPPGMGSEQSASSDELALMTIRSEGQFNTVVYEETDRYRNLAGRHAILMNPADVQGQGLVEGERVRVSSHTGTMIAQVVSFTRIKPGTVAAYFPEANVLVSRAVDARSRTPGFKSVLVTVRPVTTR